MKTFLIPILCIFFLSAIGQESKDDFFHEDWEGALTKAKEDNKILLVDYYTDWCGWCKVMDKNTFNDSIVRDFLDDNFVVLKINAEKDLGIDLAMKYRVMVFPSILFYNPQGYLIKKSLGYQDAEKFMKTLKDIVKINDQGLYYKGINQDIKLDFPEFYAKAFGKYGKREFPDSKIVMDYLNGQENLFNEVNFSVIYRFKTDSIINNYFLENYDKYKSLYGVEDVEYKFNSIINPIFSDVCQTNDTVKLFELLDMIEKYSSGDKELARWYAYNNYLKATSNWTKLSESVLERLKENEVESSILNDYAWRIYENSDDSKSIENAISWMKEVVEKEPVYMYLDTYAALLYKNKIYNEAEAWAIKAIEAGKKEKTNISETEKLLKKIREEQQ